MEQKRTLSLPALTRVPLFSALSAEELQALTPSLRRRCYAKGEVIFRQEHPGDGCYIIETGRVKMSVSSSDAKQIILALLGPGDMFGELALLDGKPRSADAIAVECCQVLVLLRDDFLSFLRSRSEACLKLMEALARRLRRTDELLQDAIFLDVPGRLAKVLVNLAESQGQTVPEGTLIPARLTQGELAALVGTTRESINKWLSFYQQRGLVNFNGGRIVVKRLAELRRHIY